MVSLHRHSQHLFHWNRTFEREKKNDLLVNMNSRLLANLALLDLGATFDTIDHGLLMHKLRSAIGFKEPPFLDAIVFRGKITANFNQWNSFMKILSIQCGLSRGSCLGTILIAVYSSKLFEILKFPLTTSHAYTDNIQLYLSFSSVVSINQTNAISSVENRIREFRQWMFEVELMLNDNKTEVCLLQFLNGGKRPQF